MQKSKWSLILGLGLATVITGSAMASTQDASCSVLGFHQPGTNIYDGPTSCGDIALSSLTVRGPLQLSGTKVTGTTDVSGPVTASKAKLKNLVLEAQLKGVKVTLQQGATVSGNVTFKGKAGTLYLQSGSTVGGKVINGSVVKR